MFRGVDFYSMDEFLKRGAASEVLEKMFTHRYSMVITGIQALGALVMEVNIWRWFDWLILS